MEGVVYKGERIREWVGKKVKESSVLLSECFYGYTQVYIQVLAWYSTNTMITTNSSVITN